MSTSIVCSMLKAVSAKILKFWFTKTFDAKRIAMRRNKITYYESVISPPCLTKQW